MTNRYDKIARLTMRWALPTAAILLPGGFVLLAVGWFCKRVATRPGTAPLPPATTNPIESPEFMAIVRANLTTARADAHCACIRHGAMRRLPAAASLASPAPRAAVLQ
jgi:hypothetical protein